MIHLAAFVVFLVALVSVNPFFISPINPNKQLNAVSRNSNAESNRDSKPKKDNNNNLSKTSINNNNNKKGSTPQNEKNDDSIRLNKCLSSLSRRAADEAIETGRVTINNRIAKLGDRVNRGDVVMLDGSKQQWQQLAKAKAKQPSFDDMETRDFIYLKYWKPTGVTCTSDPLDKSNIINKGKFDLFPQRLFTVGRLDKDSTGLILLTSDGRVNNALLSPNLKKEKTYEVVVSPTPTDEDISKLSDGVIITTDIQRDGGTKSITAKTLPCKVRRNGRTEAMLEFTLVEGRNRQIRKMVESLGYNVITLHRTSFSGITLKSLSEDNWCELNEREMQIVYDAIEQSS